MTKQVPTRIANILINALKGGVVPRAGLEYITVGRTQEIAAILHDIEMIEEGGASFRFIVGKYGSGKSFLLQTIRNYATAKGFAVVDADLSPERRFAGTKGQGLATYKELIKNLSTKSKPDGGALPLILEKWISGIQASVKDSFLSQGFGNARDMEGSPAHSGGGQGDVKNGSPGEADAAEKAVFQEGQASGKAQQACPGETGACRAAEGSAALTDALARKGIAYDDIAVYQTLYLFPYTRALRKELEAGKIDAVTFTSASTVRGFLSTVGADADFSRTVGLCIGEQTAGEARKHGIPVRVAEKATIDSLVELVSHSFLGEQRKESKEKP